MRLAAKRALSISVACLLVFSVVQVLPVATALSTPTDSLPARPMPGFSLKGSASGSLPVTVSIAIPLRNIGLLSSLVKQVSDPTSPSFRHFLTQQQLATMFYPTAKFDQLMRYLSTTGLQVEYTALDSTVVLQGTAAQVRAAFGTDVKVYSNGTSSYYATTSQSFEGAYLFGSNATALTLRPAAAAASLGGANVTFTEGSFSPTLLPKVYNATALYAEGYNGSGKTIGILDFYGSPTIRSDLAAFDERFGVPAATFEITPIGPYAPNLGAYTGWSGEISLDVELSHTMAPGAKVDLYAANGALTLADAISKIVQDDSVNTLSQSFTVSEWAYSYYGAAFFSLNALMPDQYYMLGSLEGITFSSSTGDTGGSGFSSGVEGNLGYPASSPYVTATGGTQTYFAGNSFVQTGWSNPGWVPNYVNYGGSTGGISVLEPKPWYQGNQSVPASFPDGRMNPDLSLQSGVNPATYAIDSGQLVGTGGTSEASPLFAGLVALMDSAVGGSLGLANPLIYSLANNPATYSKAFTPITFGYNIPWVASKGYNLVTGWGSPNIGEISSLYSHLQSQASLNITVGLSRGVDSSGLEFTPGTVLGVNATILSSGVPVTGGSFAADLVTLSGSYPIHLAYNATAGVWAGSMNMSAQSGLAYVEVQGSSGGISGSGFAPLFAGYVGQFLEPVPTLPWSTVGGLLIAVQSQTMDGKAAPPGPVGMEVDSYSIHSNSYSPAVSITLAPVSSVLYGTLNEFMLNQSLPDGAATMVLQGSTYGYLPFFSGIYLQTTFVYPAVVAEPGAVAPGQELTLVASPIAPVNLYFLSSQETGNIVGSDVAVGSNVTAELVNPAGETVSSASLAYQACGEALRVCATNPDILNGYLQVPQDSQPGLYTIMLKASYGSETVGETINGSFFSQILVSGGAIKPAASVEPGLISSNAASDVALGASPPSTRLYQGESAHVVARIDYPNGTAVKYGQFTALVYPQSLQNDYTTLMHTEYANSQLIQLTYDPAMGAWLGNVSLPGPADAGSLAPINPSALYYSGPYAAYVTGMTVDGFPTTTALDAQAPFFLQPFVYASGTVSASAQTSGLAFAGATIRPPGTLSGDLFIGTNTVQGGSLVIEDSQINGSLVIQGGNVTLVGVRGGDVRAVNGTLTLKDSSIGSLSLEGARVVMTDSSYQSVSPALPTLSVSGLAGRINGTVQYSVGVSGQGLSTGSLAAWVDGSSVALTVTPTSSGLSAVGTLSPQNLVDGVHTFRATATQSDGLSSTVTTSFTTDASATSLAGQLRQAEANFTSLSSRLDQVSASAGSLFNLSYALAAIALIAVVVAVVALRRKPTPG